jgi:hypothetical protein
MQMTTNARDVRSYYQRNKGVVCFRKAMQRCREQGAVPTERSMRVHAIPMAALLVAFAEWAGSTGDEVKIKRQHAKLKILRRRLGAVRKTEFQDPTPNERKALSYLRRFTHQTPHEETSAAARPTPPG